MTDPSAPGDTEEEPPGNPLCNYLLDLQRKRMHLLDTLAPGRHVSAQVWIGAAFIILWILDLSIPALTGLPVALLILLGPFALMAGPFVAGWDAQLLAVRNYPSPLESPRALELLLTTPLTEKEIVEGTLAAFARYPFVGWRASRAVPVLANVVVLVAILAASSFLHRLPMDVLLMSLHLYIPAFCVFVFFPLLSALDVLLIPFGWLHRAPDKLQPTGETIWGRSGRLPTIAVALALIPVVVKVNQSGPWEPATLRWILTTACPIILLCTAIAITVIALLLPSHLARLRRGD